MSKKPKILAAMLFMYVSLICVGFASWTINNTNGNLALDANGSFLADNVINMSQCISLKSSSNIKYYKTGFVDDDNLISKTGTISLVYEINVKNCFDVFNLDSSKTPYLNFVLSLRDNGESNKYYNNYDNKTFFTYNKFSANATTSSIATIGDITIDTDASSSNISLIISNINSNIDVIEVTITYLIETPFVDNTSFKPNYDFLENCSEKIVISSQISGYNN